MLTIKRVGWTVVHPTSFGSSVGKRIHPNGLVTYYWSSTSLKAAQLVNTYFMSYALLGSKWYSYLLWNAVLGLVTSGQHKTPTGLAKIIQLKSVMNKSSD